MKNEHKLKAWIISVDMGYGHQRAAYPLKDIAFERILTANKDKMISSKERRLWEGTRNLYEALSRMKNIPLFGSTIFNTYNRLQDIGSFFPFRDQSRPIFTVTRLRNMINKGFGRSIVEYTSKKHIPVVTTHPIPAMMFDYNNKPVCCVVTDTDINRAWASVDAKKSNITYFSPCKHVTLRLEQYGVNQGSIIETGFPLPKENIGRNSEITIKDMLPRLVNLDPTGIFFEKYKSLLIERLQLSKTQRFDAIHLAKFKTHRLTITYAIGGAGAQSDIAIDIIKSLRERIPSQELILNIIVGIKLDLKIFFENAVKNMGLASYLGNGINIIFEFDKKDLFENTNKILRTTDILWTKPSEMSFYTALGIPIIIAPPIGSQETFNKEWLEHIGSGFVQEDPKFTRDWLFYWLNDGRLADAAMQGFIDAPRMGTYNIEEYLKALKDNEAGIIKSKI